MTLNPCPRCGNRAFIAHGNAPQVNGYPVWCITDKCLQLPPRPTEIEAINDWNSRAQLCSRGRLAKILAETYYERPISDEFMNTPCTGSSVYFEMADAVLAELFHEQS